MRGLPVCSYTKRSMIAPSADRGQRNETNCPWQAADGIRGMLPSPRRRVLSLVARRYREARQRVTGPILRLGIDFMGGSARFRSERPRQSRGAFALIRCDGSARLARGQSVAFARGCSSAGRALQSHCRGQGFDPPQLHCFFDILKAARRRSVGRRVPMTARVARIGGKPPK